MPMKINWNNEEHILKLQGRVYELAKKGYTQPEICKNIGCGLTTLKRKITRGGPLESAYKKGKAQQDLVLLPIAEATLVKVMCGYEYEETETVQKVTFKNGKPVATKEGTRKTKKKFYHPNIAALIFFFCNRFPDKYKSINKDHSIDDLKNIGDVLAFIRDQMNSADKVD